MGFECARISRRAIQHSLTNSFTVSSSFWLNQFFRRDHILGLIQSEIWFYMAKPRWGAPPSPLFSSPSSRGAASRRPSTCGSSTIIIIHFALRTPSTPGVFTRSQYWSSFSTTNWAPRKAGKWFSARIRWPVKVPEAGATSQIRILLQTLDFVHSHHGNICTAMGSEEDDTYPGADQEIAEL